MALLRLWALIFVFGLVTAESDSGSGSNESGKGGKYRDILKIFTQMRKDQEPSNPAPHHYNHPAYPMPAPPVDYYAQPPPPWYNYPGYPPPPYGYAPYPSPPPGAYPPYGGQPPILLYHPNAIVQPNGGYYPPQPQYQQSAPAAYHPQQNPNQQPASGIPSAATTPQTSPSSSSNSNSSTVINLQSPNSGSDPKIAQPQPPQAAGSGQQSVTYESTSYTRQLPPEYLYVAPGAPIPATHQR